VALKQALAPGALVLIQAALGHTAAAAALAPARAPFATAPSESAKGPACRTTFTFTTLEHSAGPC